MCFIRNHLNAIDSFLKRGDSGSKVITYSDEGRAHLSRLAKKCDLDWAAVDLPKNVVLVRRNVARDTPLSLCGELAELQSDLSVKLFHDNLSEIRRQAWQKQM